MAAQKWTAVHREMVVRRERSGRRWRKLRRRQRRCLWLCMAEAHGQLVVCDGGGGRGVGGSDAQTGGEGTDCRKQRQRSAVGEWSATAEVEAEAEAGGCNVAEADGTSSPAPPVDDMAGARVGGVDVFFSGEAERNQLSRAGDVG
ncbi:WRKY DNA-binding protein 55 [Striga asiatica]|uniref:WRKY DNA-binding protein 55 n=1 Tax=Striga asiatica TaxID=4170 RepID=A0A5A7R087_STRAF|nr:WRKY DNA-binding protein 55 [Striga asiatica]